MAQREARNGTLILGGGFAGSCIGRYLSKLSVLGHPARLRDEP
jgi:hypothetical protein